MDNPMTTGTNDDESWNMLVAQHQGMAMAVTQPQEHEPMQMDDNGTNKPILESKRGIHRHWNGPEVPRTLQL